MDMLFAADGLPLSRREFLRQTQRGLLALFALPWIDRAEGREKLVAAGPDAADVPEVGRVLDNSLMIYKEPSFSSKMVKIYWRDLVLPINGATIGDKLPEHNRVWYLVNNEGYAHSGNVQPVAVRRNQAVESLPEKGALVEVTVPFTDALLDPNRPDFFVYRMYYSTTHWANRVVTDLKGRKWYYIQDDKYKRKAYYILGEHVRVVQPEDLTIISPDVPVEEKRLEVHLSQQVVVAYESERPVFMTRVASGGQFVEGNYSTPIGSFVTSRKRPSRHMASGDLAAANSFDLPGVPWICYLTLRGVSFHGTYWHNDFGKARSHGCINLSPQAAQWVYRWTNPVVPFKEHTLDKEDGTRVSIID